MSDNFESRPDGRDVSANLVQVRASTRALRLHLDQLPVDVNDAVSGDRLLATLSFSFARQRYDSAESLIGAGFGGTVLGSLSRSLLFDGLRWLWIAQDPSRSKALLGSLLDERNRLVVLLEKADAACPLLPRYLMPLPDIADLSGASHKWVDADPLPSDDSLLEEFMASEDTENTLDSDGHLIHSWRTPARRLMRVSGLRGAAMILAHAGHGNYLGAQSSLTLDGAPGHDLREDHEALFMQSGAIGVTVTLLCIASSFPEMWPVDVDRQQYLSTAVSLAGHVAAAAVKVHGLAPTKTVNSRGTKRSSRQAKTTLIRPTAAKVAASDGLARYPVGPLVEAVEDYAAIVEGIDFSPWGQGDESALPVVMALTAAYSNWQTVFSTFSAPGNAMIAAFAARNLLEESARWNWRYAVTTADEFIVRAKQLGDEYRFRETKTMNALLEDGVDRKLVELILASPSNVVPRIPRNEIAKNRVPIPPVAQMLRLMGADFAEPDWLEVGYSLLSQVVHSTPLGLLHSVGYDKVAWTQGQLSQEMLGLSLDVACLGSATLIGLSSMALSDLNPAASAYRGRLLASAGRVHNAARLIHGLD